MCFISKPEATPELFGVASNFRPMKNKKSNGGFTLIEILTVLIVISVIVTVSLPVFTGMLERFTAEEGKQILWAVYTAEKRYFIENNTYVDNINSLDITLRSNKFQFYSPPSVMYNASGNPRYIGKLRRTKGGTQLYYLLLIYQDTTNPANNGQLRCINIAPNMCERIGVPRTGT